MSKTLKSCCYFQEGYVNPSQKNKEYFDGDIKWLRTLDLNNGFVYDTSRKITEKGFYSAGKSAYMFPKDSLAISKSGTIGELGILRDDMCGNRAIINIQVDNDKADLMYIFYLLKYKKDEIIKKAVGSIQKNLYISALETIELCNEDINDQKKISKILSSIDNKIENNNKINEELESMAKTIYDYWFLQFEFPNEEVKPYKSSGGKMVWNKVLKREIPEGWCVKKIYEIEDNIVTGKTPSTKNLKYYNGDIPFITIGDIRGNMYVVKTEQTLTEEGANSQNTKYIPKESLCVTCIASPGLVGFSTEDSQTNQQINTIVFSNEYNKMFLYFSINDYFRFSAGAKTGNTFKNMNKEDFSNIEIIYPNKSILEEFQRKCNSISKKILNNAKENQELEKLRDFLLPLLMNGQARFRELVLAED